MELLRERPEMFLLLTGAPTAPAVCTDRVIVSGAHLDSVAEGPGINDNGSGTAAQLETALQIAKLGIEPRNQLRFMFFGAEEAGSWALQWGGEVGEWFDPCYHQACDTYSNVDLTALDEMSDAVAHRVLTFAQTSSAVEGSDKGSDSLTNYDPDYKAARRSGSRTQQWCTAEGGQCAALRRSGLTSAC